jgi:hypothetical protein
MSLDELSKSSSDAFMLDWIEAWNSVIAQGKVCESHSHGE